MQTPGKTELPPVVLTADSTTDDMIEPTSTEDSQIAWQDLPTRMLRELLLTIF